MTEVSKAYILTISQNLQELYNFDMLLIPTSSFMTVELPLDAGVRAFLSGCEKLKNIYMHLFPRYLINIELSYIGKFRSWGG